MKPVRIIFLLIAALSFGLGLSATASAKDQWVRVRSKNFLLIGNASEKDVRKVATRLEQFRETFRQLFRSANLKSPIPTNVVVFKSESSYRPFKPKRADGKTDDLVAGYFQPGDDVNYITLSMEGDDKQSFGTIFHEYVHFIVNTNFGKSDVPPWFNEGLAEYYQTFEIVEDQKAKLGIFQQGHLWLLEQNRLMPLEQLFSITNYQLHQSGDHSRSIFYAESWALIHYLIQKGKQEGLVKFLNAVRRNTPISKAFQDAFQMTLTEMEAELQKYVGQSKYTYQIVAFKEKLLFDADMTAEPLDEAGTDAYLGDLLYHTNRPKEAEIYLSRALAADPGSVLANTAMGLVKLRQDKLAEARVHLERAIAGDARNHLALFSYAQLLARGELDDFGLATSIDPQKAGKIREVLAKVIAIDPTFTETYELLAFVSLVSGERLDEAAAGLQTALKYQPGSQRYAIRLAEVLFRQDKMDEARVLAARIAATADDPEIRSRAQRLVASTVRDEEDNTGRVSLAKGSSQIRKQGEKVLTEAEIAKLHADMTLRSINLSMRKPGPGERMVIGRVQQVDCKKRPITIVVKTGDQTLSLTTADFDRLHLNTFNQSARNVQVGCDENLAHLIAAVTFRPVSGAPGQAVAVEFLPDDFRILTTEEMDAIARSADVGHVVVRAETRERMIERIRGVLRTPAAGERRVMGNLDKIECRDRGIIFHIRTGTGTLKLAADPQYLAIVLHTADLEGMQFGCQYTPVEHPVVVIFKNAETTAKAATGELVSLEFAPKGFVLE